MAKLETLVIMVRTNGKTTTDIPDGYKVVAANYEPYNGSGIVTWLKGTWVIVYEVP